MRDRTADLLRARQALSQLSYSPFFSKVNLFQSKRRKVICALAHELYFNAEWDKFGRPGQT